MNAQNFVYWINGYVELNGGCPTEEQWEQIKAHLRLCMLNVTNPILSFPQFSAPDFGQLRPLTSSVYDENIC